MKLSNYIEKTKSDFELEVESSLESSLKEVEKLDEKDLKILSLESEKYKNEFELHNKELLEFENIENISNDVKDLIQILNTSLENETIDKELNEQLMKKCYNILGFEEDNVSLEHLDIAMEGMFSSMFKTMSNALNSFVNLFKTKKSLLLNAYSNANNLKNKKVSLKDTLNKDDYNKKYSDLYEYSNRVKIDLKDPDFLLKNLEAIDKFIKNDLYGFDIPDVNRMVNFFSYAFKFKNVKVIPKDLIEKTTKFYKEVVSKQQTLTTYYLNNNYKLRKIEIKLSKDYKNSYYTNLNFEKYVDLFEVDVKESDLDIPDLKTLSSIKVKNVEYLYNKFSKALSKGMFKKHLKDPLVLLDVDIKSDDNFNVGIDKAAIVKNFSTKKDNLEEKEEHLAVLELDKDFIEMATKVVNHILNVIYFVDRLVIVYFRYLILAYMDWYIDSVNAWDEVNEEETSETPEEEMNEMME